MTALLGLFGVHVLILFWTFVVSKIISLFHGGGGSLVVQKLTIQAAGSTQAANAVEIAGRREGLVAFLLTLAGLSPTTSLVVNDREAVCKTTGLLGIENRSIPMDRVAQVTSGSKVAFEYIAGAVVMFFVGFLATVGFLWRFEFLPLIGSPLVTALAMVAMVALYLLNKRFFVGVFPQAGPPMFLAFKPNVIEGVELNLERAMEIAAMIRGNALKGILDHPEAASARPQLARPVAQAPAPPAISLPLESVPEVEEAMGPRELMLQAKDLLKSTQRGSAIPLLQRIVREFPGTNEAKQARSFLERAGVNT